MTIEFRVVPVVFEGPGQHGDFVWMRAQPEYANALFVFNDNEEQFVAFERGQPEGVSPGGGNAGVRPWRGENPPRSAGIPTGRRGRGYGSLDAKVTEVLGRAFAEIQALVDSGRYDTMVFSRDSRLEALGASIFAPDPLIRQLVYRALVRVKPGHPSPWSDSTPGGTGVTHP
ncbi:MAG: hypothetical protein ACO3Q4_05770 [Ilumatobacteraceae bacterium]